MFGLLNDNYEIIVYELKGKLKEYFDNKIGTFILSNQRNIPYPEFSLEFKLYNFYNIILNYDRGRFGCAILYCESKGVGLPNSQQWYDKDDLDISVRELDEEIRLRIPDKYLKHYGWL